MRLPLSSPDFFVPGTGRSLLVFAVGAMLGLLIAGASLFSAAGSSLAIVPPEDAATVNGRPILISDYVAQLQSQFGVTLRDASEEQKRKVLTDMVNEELMVQRGLELDLPGTDGDVRAALVNGVQLQVTANVLAARPSEEQLRRYYTAHREKYRTNGTLTIEELVLPNAKAAEAAHGALASGAPAAKVALRNGGRLTGRLSSPTFDLTARLLLGDAVYDSVEALKVGEVSKPIAQPDGIHLARVTQRLPPVLPPFEGAIQSVYSDYLIDARKPVEAANHVYLRRHARILYATGFKE